MAKRKDITKAALEQEAREVELAGRSTMTKEVMAYALNDMELNTRLARFSNEPGDPADLTPKQRRRVTQKMNRQK